MDNPDRYIYITPIKINAIYIYTQCISILHMDASYIENAPKSIVLSGSSRTNRPLHTPPRGTTHPRAARALTQPHQNHPGSLSNHTQLNNPHVSTLSISKQQLLSLFASAARPRRRIPPHRGFPPRVQHRRLHPRLPMPDHRRGGGGEGGRCAEGSWLPRVLVIR